MYMPGVRDRKNVPSYLQHEGINYRRVTTFTDRPSVLTYMEDVFPLDYQVYDDILASDSREYIRNLSNTNDSKSHTP